MTACFEFSAVCTLDWDGVSAIATLAASAVALFSSWVAITGPERRLRKERDTAVAEAVAVSSGGVALYREFMSINHCDLRDEALLNFHERAGALLNSMGAMLASTALDRGSRELVSMAASLIQRIPRIPLQLAVYGRDEGSRNRWEEGTQRARDEMYEAQAIIPLIQEKAAELSGIRMHGRWPR